MSNRRRSRTRRRPHREDLRERRPLADLTAAEYEEWDARTLMAATRAWATFKLVLGARLARVDPDHAGPPFCERPRCLKRSQCLGDDRPQLSAAGHPAAPPCMASLIDRFGTADGDGTPEVAALLA